MLKLPAEANANRPNRTVNQGRLAIAQTDAEPLQYSKKYTDIRRPPAGRPARQSGARGGGIVDAHTQPTHQLPSMSDYMGLDESDPEDEVDEGEEVVRTVYPFCSLHGKQSSRFRFSPPVERRQH